MKRITFILSVTIFFISCSTEPEILETFEHDYNLVITDSLKLDPLPNLVLQFGASESNDDINFHYHNGSDKIFLFDSTGKHINTISTPGITEPYGINRINDYHYINKDSIFIYDSEFNRIVLINDSSKIFGFWDFLGQTFDIGRSANGKIIDVDKVNGDLIIHVNSAMEDHPPSSKQFLESNKMIFSINLSKMTFKSGVKYPQDSPYRDYLFWNAKEPEVEKYRDQYLVLFPLDHRLFVYDMDFKLVQTVNSQPANFPRAIGNKFNSYQTRDWVKVNVKLNALGLRTKHVFDYKGDKLLARVYRAPLGDRPEIPEDMDEFIKKKYTYDFYLQLFFLDSDGQWKKMSKDILLPTGKMSNLVHIDHRGKLYFVGKDDNKETEFFYICELKESM